MRAEGASNEPRVRESTMSMSIKLSGAQPCALASRDLARLVAGPLDI